VTAAGIPVLVGGAYAFAIYTGIERHTKDLDIFVQRVDYDRAARILSDAGYDTQLTFPHWLGKALGASSCVDIIFSSGNGIGTVDHAWFDHAMDADVLGVHAKIVPAEEMIWHKSFVMERERYDGADVAHLVRARGKALDWARLMRRMEPHWRVLLSHLVVFGFIYPGHRADIPTWVMDQLLERLRDETHAPAPTSELCCGTLVSREQYLHDVGQQGYVDARLAPFGSLSAEDVATWTEDIAEHTTQHRQ
jgi:hypothetical protein